MNLGNGDEHHPQSEWRQEIRFEDVAAKLGADIERRTRAEIEASEREYSEPLPRSDVDALRERIATAIERDWPEIRLRLACGEAAEAIRRGDQAGALATLENVLAQYDR